MIARFRSLFGLSAQRPPERPRRPRLTLRSPLPTIYAVGDVHGCFDQLLDCERRIVADAGGAPGVIVMLGDYVDRGPRSSDVLEHLIAPPPPGFRRICLAGNHDDAMASFVADPRANMTWLDFGGDETLRSYGVDIVHLLRHGGPKSLPGILAEAIPRRHLDLLAGLPVALVADDFLFVHAGVVPGIPIGDQADEDLMWIREPFLSEGPGFAATVVHGHTPARQPSFAKGRIGIDTGAYMTGCLTVLKITGGVAAVL
jgi:serine/threonine protein phosphatase 1